MSSIIVHGPLPDLSVLLKELKETKIGSCDYITLHIPYRAEYQWIDAQKKFVPVDWIKTMTSSQLNAETINVLSHLKPLYPEFPKNGLMLYFITGSKDVRIVESSVFITKFLYVCSEKGHYLHGLLDMIEYERHAARATSYKRVLTTAKTLGKSIVSPLSPFKRWILQKNGGDDEDVISTSTTPKSMEGQSASDAHQLVNDVSSFTSTRLVRAASKKSSPGLRGGTADKSLKRALSSACVRHMVKRVKVNHRRRIDLRVALPKAPEWPRSDSDSSTYSTPAELSGSQSSSRSSSSRYESVVSSADVDWNFVFSPALRWANTHYTSQMNRLSYPSAGPSANVHSPLADVVRSANIQFVRPTLRLPTLSRSMKQRLHFSEPNYLKSRNTVDDGALSVPTGSAPEASSLISPRTSHPSITRPKPKPAPILIPSPSLPSHSPVSNLSSPLSELSSTPSTPSPLRVSQSAPNLQSFSNPPAEPARSSLSSPFTTLIKEICDLVLSDPS